MLLNVQSTCHIVFNKSTIIYIMASEIVYVIWARENHWTMEDCCYVIFSYLLRHFSWWVEETAWDEAMAPAFQQGFVQTLWWLCNSVDVLLDFIKTATEPGICLGRYDIYKSCCRTFVSYIYHISCWWWLVWARYTPPPSGGMKLVSGTLGWLPDIPGWK